MAGGSNMGDALKEYAKQNNATPSMGGFPLAPPGPGVVGIPQGAANPQATAAPATGQQAMAPWMQGQQQAALGQLGGQMGQQMMQAGRMPMLQAPQMHPHMMNGGPGQMNMPQPTMQQQPLTPELMNQLLARRTGLLGRP